MRFLQLLPYPASNHVLEQFQHNVDWLIRKKGFKSKMYFKKNDTPKCLNWDNTNSRTWQRFSWKYKIHCLWLINYNLNTRVSRVETMWSNNDKSLLCILGLLPHSAIVAKYSFWNNLCGFPQLTYLTWHWWCSSDVACWEGQWGGVGSGPWSRCAFWERTKHARKQVCSL